MVCKFSFELTTIIITTQLYYTGQTERQDQIFVKHSLEVKIFFYHLSDTFCRGIALPALFYLLYDKNKTS